jgi:hypothetical protein
VERAQVAVVDADERCPCRCGAAQFLRRVHFHQRIHLQLVFRDAPQA